MHRQAVGTGESSLLFHFRLSSTSGLLMVWVQGLGPRSRCWSRSLSLSLYLLFLSMHVWKYGCGGCRGARPLGITGGDEEEDRS